MSSQAGSSTRSSMTIGTRLGLFIVLFFTLVSVFSPWLAPFKADQNFQDALKRPPAWSEGGQAQFVFGTDDLGRDILSRLIRGAPVSLGLGLSVVIFSILFGTFTGLLAGTIGGWVDQGCSRIMDIIMALPSMLMAIVVIAVLGPSLTNTVIALGLVGVPSIFRIVRGGALGEVRKNYVIAAKTFGAGWFRVAFRHVLPNCMSLLIVQGTLGLSNAILDAAALGFLGLGAQPPIPEWGTMLSDSRSFIESSPWMVTLPGLCILLVVIGLNLLGDSLRDRLDPKLRKIS
ncbi:MAG: ABC transporter permease subunit [Bdellovibrionales bacterium]|jgi:ABC-type dipeptide/oligopeptide/nickel transport system permease subunit|nr:ABC transporter permease subunit [Bdellovibrionales bacterium]